MNSNTKRGLILATMVAVALLVAFYDLTTHTFPSDKPPDIPSDILKARREHAIPWDMELFYTVKTVISTINVALLVFLLATYLDVYRNIKSEFTIALVVFSIVLLFYALSSNPLVYQPFGFRAFGLGPFAMLSDLFTCIAVSILIYLSFKY